MFRLEFPNEPRLRTQLPGLEPIQGSTNTMTGMFAELRRRHVFRVAIAYVVVAWLIVQAAALIEEALNLPPWFDGVALALVALGFPIALVIAWAFELTPEGIKRSVPLGPQVASNDLSIAVLPFVNMSSDADQEYFSDGLSEELLNELAHIPDLHVAGRTSCFAFKGRNDDLRVIGDKLGVAHVLEGSVRKDGDKLRITAQLVSAKNGYHLWSETYNRRLDDIFALQEEIARSVANALSVTLGVAVADATAAGASDVEAYDLYLRGLSLVRQLTSSESFLRAAEVFRAAIALDPDFGRARVLLAEAYVPINVLFPERTEQNLHELEVVVAEAMAHAPDDPNSHYASALLHLQRHEWRAADTAFARAGAGSDPVWAVRSVPYLAVLRLQVGRAADAIELLEEAVRTDPLAFDASNWLQQALTIAGRNEEAELEYGRAIELGLIIEPMAHMALFRVWNGDDNALIKERFDAFIAAQLIATPLPAALRDVHADIDAARALVRAAAESPEQQDAMRQAFIGVYAAHFGDTELALASLHRALIEMKGLSLPHALWFPDMAAVRRDPGFKDLVRNLGLLEYWSETGSWGDFCRPIGETDFECI
jgi:TolB-like protein